MKGGCRRILLIILGGALALVLAFSLFIYARTGPSPACRRAGAGPLTPGWSVRTMETGEQAGNDRRCYFIYVPEELPDGESVPLVITLHGFAGQARSMPEMTGWNEIATREGFVVVYPEGTEWPVRWNAAPAFNSDARDVRYMRDLVAEISRLLPIDSQRIYVNGMSNGAAMTRRVACHLADQIAAIGTVAGPYPTLPEGCAPARPLPLITFHGTDDELVAYEGTSVIPGSQPSGRFFGLSDVPSDYDWPAVGDWAAAWAADNGCRPIPESLQVESPLRAVAYRGCKQNADVLFYTIVGGRHAWPRATATGQGVMAVGVEAAELMWDFFVSHPLPAEGR